MSKHKALEVARYVINHCNDKQYEITNLRLQKILYFIQANFLVEKNCVCFADKIQAWDFGPVIPDVYHEFKVYGSQNIPKIKEYYEVGDSYFNIKKVPYKPKFTEEEKGLINEIIHECNKFSTNQLMLIIHGQKPWMDAYSNKYDNVMHVEDIKNFFVKAQKQII